MARRKTITKDQVLNAAYSLVSTEGFDKFTARNIAQRMKCSTQPIYLEFENMEDLRTQVLEMIKKHLVNDVFSKEITGEFLYDIILNYIEFARNERVMYRAIYVEENLDPDALNQFNLQVFMKHMNQDEEFAQLSDEKKHNLFISTWILATGIATLNSSGLYRPSREQIISLIDEVRDMSFEYEKSIEFS
ncbi:TetR/AcrR family transcriptional regulator [Vagococcus xieshaowenii]|uniref:TetR/AcrR family transcriptional regulator n=1 Tax=Vagococcus xieshaowenii TaxID=2562451 RepID=A0AAJ5EF71_9ENTE|nr:TetR/AcrR family transcriptional regulator [Vagococcus xieshaowenii]QCA29278.1 TetR/AcrR family transcriptional regulator [Vagococcus xieshaowenii]TFZ39860.1 TetR/AcrR family transcriptional regulator [Vagococcus xieshaowenii]